MRHLPKLPEDRRGNSSRYLLDSSRIQTAGHHRRADARSHANRAVKACPGRFQSRNHRGGGSSERAGSQIIFENIRRPSCISHPYSSLHPTSAIFGHHSLTFFVVNFRWRTRTAAPPLAPRLVIERAHVLTPVFF